MSKFKVGDRVRVNEKGKDNWDILEEKGVDFATVIHVRDNGHIGVEFDKHFGGHDCSGKCKDGHGWWLRSEELELVKDEPKEELTPVPVININVTINNYDNACWYCRKGGIVDLYLEGAMGICPNCKRVCNDVRKGFTLTNTRRTIIEFKAPKRKNEPLTAEEYEALPVGTKVFVVWKWDLHEDCKDEDKWELPGWGVKGKGRCEWTTEDGYKHGQGNRDYDRCFDVYLEEPERPIPEPDDEIPF